MAYELDQSVLLAPEALRCLQQLPSDNPEVAAQQTSIYLQPDRLQNMADELDTPVYMDDLAIVLSAGKRLTGSPDVPFKKADPNTPYTPALHVAVAADLPSAIPKEHLQGRTVLDVKVNKWTDEHLAKQVAHALQLDTLAIRSRNRYIRIAGEVGGMLVAWGVAAVSEDKAVLWGSAAGAIGAALYALGEVVVGQRQETKAYDKQSLVATHHHPLKLIRESV